MGKENGGFPWFSDHIFALSHPWVRVTIEPLYRALKTTEAARQPTRGSVSQPPKIPGSREKRIPGSHEKQGGSLNGTYIFLRGRDQKLDAKIFHDLRWMQIEGWFQKGNHGDSPAGSNQSAASRSSKRWDLSRSYAYHIYLSGQIL